jgi:putative transposase
MARLARVVAVDIAHHVTQRGNRREYILTSDAERMVYLDLLSQAIQVHSVSVIGYCLMSNHVHLILIPHKQNSLALAMKDTHGPYASYWNASHASSGHAWQGRFYSCPLDPMHLWEALRYTELNPVRAGMVAHPELWRWSSAAAHCGTAQPDVSLSMELWQQQWTAERWKLFLGEGESDAQLTALRQCTHTGRPFGSEEFIASLEKATQRRLAPQKGGRRSKRVDNGPQSAIDFDR